MLRSKIMVFIFLMTWVLGMVASKEAAAGEKLKLRTVMFAVKWEMLDPGDEEGHLIGVAEGKGIQSIVEGKPICDGCVVRYGALVDINVKTGLGSGRGYAEVTDRDDDRYYYRRRGKLLRMEEWGSYWEGECTIVKGTGKYEGIKGKGIWSAYVVAPMQWYYDEEVEVELPRQ